MADTTVLTRDLGITGGPPLTTPLAVRPEPTHSTAGPSRGKPAARGGAGPAVAGSGPVYEVLSRNGKAA